MTTVIPTAAEAQPLGPSERLEGRPARTPEVHASVPDFAELSPAGHVVAPKSLDRLLDVTVSVTAELGRVTLPIADVLKLGVGSVIELDRLVGEPVDLLVQGVSVASGEVVVVDDRFAVRVKAITEARK